MRSLILLSVPVFALALVPACGNGRSSPLPPVGTPTGLRLTGSRTAGAEADALAASLLLSASAVATHTGRPAFQMADGELAKELAFRAQTHLEAQALAAGDGPRLEGSARIRRQAALPNAPQDQNGNGTNLDEAMAADLQMLADLTGGGIAPGVRPLLFSWDSASADLVASPGLAGRSDIAAWRTQSTTGGTVSMEQIGHAMQARLLEASRLLAQSRGSYPGATPAEGMLGLLYLQQVAAIEESLLGSLFYDGTVMGRMGDPPNYDPTKGAQWLPAMFATADEPGLPGAPATYLAIDQAGSLSGLAAVLSASSELAWLASDRNPNPAMRDVLQGSPFGVKPAPRRGRPVSAAVTRQAGGAPTAGGAAEVTWDDHIRPLLQGRGSCFSCHSGPFAAGQFDVSTYQSTLAGGKSAAIGYPTIVKGDHAASLLWQILIGNTPVAPQMPLGRALPAADVSLVQDWIDQGAPQSKSTGTAAPKLGLDLGGVMVKNLLALHLDPTTGGLHDRNEGDAPSGWATAHSTGDALVALSSYIAAAVPGDQAATAALASAATFAAQRLAAPDGSVLAGIEIATGQNAGPADLNGHARLTSGLLAAGRALGRQDLRIQGQLQAQQLIEFWFDTGTGLFRTALDRQGRRYTPGVVAAVLAALREAAADGGVSGATAAHDRFLGVLRTVLAYSEWDGRGEVLGDGIADTDGNGVPEPAAAGGAFGRAPLLAGEILEGPSPADETSSEPVTWSKHVKPLLRLACATCHLGNANQGNYRVDTPTLLRTPGDSGGILPLIVPFDPEASFFYRKLVDRRPPVGEQMPLAKPPLDDRGQALIRQWILEGATNR